MVVKPRSLTGTPGHHDDRVVELGVAVQQPAGVRLFAARGVGLRQRELAARAENADLALDVIRDGLHVAEANGLVEAGDQFLDGRIAGDGHDWLTPPKKTSRICQCIEYAAPARVF